MANRKQQAKKAIKENLEASQPPQEIWPEPLTNIAPLYLEECLDYEELRPNADDYLELEEQEQAYYDELLWNEAPDGAW